MNKKVIVLFILVIALIFSVFEAIRHSKDIENAFWNAVIRQLDKEEAEREAKIERGEPFAGRDTVVIWDNMYEISKYSNEKNLDIQTKELAAHIIGKIQKYKTKKGKHYILSEEGYVVIDENSLCRVFVSIPDEEFISGYSIDKDGTKYYHSKKLKKNKYVSYLSDYDEFSAEEKKIFEQMKKPESKLKKPFIITLVIFIYILLSAILITIVICIKNITRKLFKRMNL